MYRNVEFCDLLMYSRSEKGGYSTSVSCFIYRGYLLFLGEYQIYFIECVENIRIFTSSQQE